MELGIQGNAGEEFSAFVGREHELSEICRIAGAVGALTLCGAGGIGSTRLATRAAATLWPALPAGAGSAPAGQPGFARGLANVAMVAAICRAVDGLPLGIELAAAWVRMLTVEQIAARLADRFGLLSSAERMALPRHRTLRAAIDWSHDLLPPAEKVLLRRLSVFAGWPLEMAENACAGLQPDDELAAGDILNLLAGLADRSLVIAEPDADGRIRYRMLDTIRAYAAERLDEAGETHEQRARFRDYTVSEVEHAALIGMALLPGTWPERVETFRRVEAANPQPRPIPTWGPV